MMTKFKYRIERANGRIMARGTSKKLGDSDRHLDRLLKKYGGWLETILDEGPDAGAPLESGGTMDCRVFTVPYHCGNGRKFKRGTPVNVLMKTRTDCCCEVEVKPGTFERIDFPKSDLLAFTRRLENSEL